MFTIQFVPELAMHVEPYWLWMQMCKLIVHGDKETVMAWLIKTK